MRPSKFTEEQILAALQQVKGGTPAVEVCRTLGITQTTFYRWRGKFQGMVSNESRQLRELRDENQRLRRVVTDLLLEQQRVSERPRRK